MVINYALWNKSFVIMTAKISYNQTESMTIQDTISSLLQSCSRTRILKLVTFLMVMAHLKYQQAINLAPIQPQKDSS